MSSKSLMNNDSTFYRVCRKKKEENGSVGAVEPKPGVNRNWPSISIYENGKGSEEFHNKSNNQIR